MLPSDLLIHRQNGEELVPKRLPLDKRNQAIATDLIALFQNCQGKTQGELERQLKELEGTSTDYRIKRGLAHLLKSDTFSTFEVVSPLEPQLLRSRVFAQSAQSAPLPQTAPFTLKTIAEQLSQELNQEVLPSQIRTGLYADLNENKILTRFDAPTPEALLHRYNVSQVQGIFYKASQIRITAHRNDPGEYKLLFRYLILFGLMAYIEGDADHGFTITIDGPTSLFKPSTRYGLDIAKLIPALLHVSKWSLVADLHLRDTYTKAEKTRRFALTSEGGLVTHYPPGKPYDSMLESSFVDRWESLKSEWKLEREVDLIPIPGSVMIPDFRLVHPSGRSVLLEIVGYWRPEYLRKKFSQVRQSGRDDLILAISERLNLEKAGVKLTNVSTPIVWFKDKLLPKAVLAVLEEFEEFDLA
jgi:predicted nuclease of restriction endonuclease-like RecB superfamily